MRRDFVLAALVPSCLVLSLAMAQAQGTPQPVPPSAPPQVERPPTRTLSPSESFGSVYGTDNLASPPSGTVLPTTVPPQVPTPHALVLRPELLQAAQNERTQPPPDINAYASYVSNDALLSQLDHLKNTPQLDPTLPVLLAWNHVALDMTSIDHTTAGQKISVAGSPSPLPVFETTYGEQFGPPRSSRAMAIVHLAMFEAANLIDYRYASYRAPGAAQDLRSTILAGLGGSTPNPQSASVAAAISQAARDSLVALYPKKAALIDVSFLRISILVSAQESARGTIAAASRLSIGKAVGMSAAAAVLATRKNDGSTEISDPEKCKPSYPNQPPETLLPAPLCWEQYFPGLVPVPMDPITWTIDPISAQPLQLGATWKDVTPFVLDKHEFITPSGISLGHGSTLPLPKANDLAFKASLDEGAYGPQIPDPHGGATPIASKYGVRTFGGWGAPPGTPVTFPAGQGPRALTPTDRTASETVYGNFWGYDATALLCAPPRLYNMVATSFYLEHMKPSSDPHAAVELARYLALVNIALADAGIAAWDGKFTYKIARPITYIRNHAPEAAHPDDDTWTPLGQVGSNGAVANVTPPFPAYPSGHAVFGAAAFTVISKVTNLDKKTSSTGFDFVSDEYNGHTFGSDGRIRPMMKVHYVSLQSAEWENAESRIFLGIHWQRDADDGIALGDAIAETIYEKTLRPLPNP